MIDYAKLTGSHDLTLSDWGPYSYDMSGISHVTDLQKGLRMDFFFVPAHYRRIAFAPESLRECGCTPWEASPDFSYWSYRQTMIPGAFRDTEDMLSADTSFSRISENLRLARIEYKNRTDSLREVSLYGYARLADQPALEARLPEGAQWIDALDYASLTFAKPRFDEHLVYAAGRRGERPNPNAVNGRCLGRPYANILLPGFGANAGDTASWTISGATGKLYMRASLPKGTQMHLRFSFEGKSCDVTVNGTGNFELLPLEIPCQGNGTLTLLCPEGATEEGIAVDGFVIAPATAPATSFEFLPISRSVTPRSKKVAAQSTELEADGFDMKYIFWWDRPEGTEREYSVSDIRTLLAYSHGIKHILYGAKEVSRQYPGNEFCHETYLTPIEVPAHGNAVVYFLMGASTDEAALLKEFNAIDRRPEALEAIYQKARQNAFRYENPLAGDTINFGQQLLSSVVMNNCLFPIRCCGRWIRHHSPDKYYHSLYTWDSGFIGLGLLELDVRRGVENLNAYICEKDEENAFVNLGTPLPVQAYLYAEIWNRTQDLEMLEHYYPRLRRYYDFMAGHIENSTFRSFKTNLLCGFNYFYNSGGWDDYPAQWHLFRSGYSSNATPVVTTAHVIRFARILQTAADILLENKRLTQEQHDTDQAQYAEDLQAFTDALQKYAWSEKDGIFSYVRHNGDGSYQAPLLHQESGVNFNFGFDGVSPLVSDVCPPEQQKILWNLLKTPGRCWTPFGLTAVDQKAPYYRKDGYWNGSVWMPHQWFFWKAALAAGDAEFSRRIAKTALSVLSEETLESRGIYEHYSAVTGKGAGCFHFGGLSSIGLSFYAAYYKAGRLTTGIGTWILKQEPLQGGGIRATMECKETHGISGIALYATGQPKADWKVTIDGKPAAFEAFEDGSLEIRLPVTGRFTLAIEAATQTGESAK